MTLLRKFRYIGYIKYKPHYANLCNEVFSPIKGGGAQYEGTWLEDYKMLWTDHPMIYRLVTFKAMNYFYDMENKDAYYYDHDMKLVMPAGFYDPKTHTFKKLFWE